MRVWVNVRMGVGMGRRHARMSASVTVALSGRYLAIPESQFALPFALWYVHGKAIHHVAFSLALRRGMTGRYAWTRHHISIPLSLALPLSVTYKVGMEGIFSLALFAFPVSVPVPFGGWMSEELALTWQDAGPSWPMRTDRMWWWWWMRVCVSRVMAVGQGMTVVWWWWRCTVVWETFSVVR